MTIWDNFLDMLYSVIMFIINLFESAISIALVIFAVVFVITYWIIQAFTQLTDRIFYDEPITIKEDIQEYIETVKKLWKYFGII